MYRDKRFRVVIGIGLNLSNREPTTCVDAAIEDVHSRLHAGTAAVQPVEPEARRERSALQSCVAQHEG